MASYFKRVKNPIKERKEAGAVKASLVANNQAFDDREEMIDHLVIADSALSEASLPTKTTSSWYFRDIFPGDPNENKCNYLYRILILQLMAGLSTLFLKTAHATMNSEGYKDAFIAREKDIDAHLNSFREFPPTFNKHSKTVPIWYSRETFPEGPDESKAESGFKSAPADDFVREATFEDMLKEEHIRVIAGVNISAIELCYRSPKLIQARDYLIRYGQWYQDER
ncbi:hypothetical protein BJ878DRAFT_538036 [Calycina marina]|uniref:Uncharacterized protein n=1 Tax=Calycina marina TaxID=1763456 RepID=A0A9P8CJA8_9HELO|nr:hypothetical protein BJ878DRAFT_538036 [Calycina marina]